MIPVIEAVCSSSGHEMQDYLREQPGRTLRSDGITIIVDYLLVLTRYFPVAVAGYNLQGKQHSDTKNFGKLVVKQIAISLEALASIVDGPNTLNQEHAVGGSLLEIVSKFLEALNLRDLLRELRVGDEEG